MDDVELQRPGQLRLLHRPREEGEDRLHLDLTRRRIQHDRARVAAGAEELADVGRILLLESPDEEVAVHEREALPVGLEGGGARDLVRMHQLGRRSQLREARDQRPQLAELGVAAPAEQREAFGNGVGPVHAPEAGEERGVQRIGVAAVGGHQPLQVGARQTRGLAHGLDQRAGRDVRVRLHGRDGGVDLQGADAGAPGEEVHPGGGQRGERLTGLLGQRALQRGEGAEKDLALGTAQEDSRRCGGGLGHQGREAHPGLELPGLEHLGREGDGDGPDAPVGGGDGESPLQGPTSEDRAEVGSPAAEGFGQGRHGGAISRGFAHDVRATQDAPREPS